MKRHIFLVAFFVAWPGLTEAFAADSPLEILAARQELEDFIRSTNTRLRDLEEALHAQQKRISALEEENQTLRADLARLGRSNPAAGLEQDVRQLAQDIKEVDNRRLADNKLTLQKLERLERVLKTPSAPAPRETEPKISRNADLFEYEVQKGDNLYKIISKIRANEGVVVSPKAVQDANPGVVWTQLQIGQKLIIPVTKD